MSSGILTTKLFAPAPRPELVCRNRLRDRLQASLQYALTLVCAPAGFGKSTAVAQWAAGAPAPVAWVSLDPDDGEITRFLLYLVAALQQVDPTIGGGLVSALQSPAPPSPASAMTRVVNDLARLEDDVVLVLDDYHALDSAETDHALQFLVEHIGPNAHLVICSREDPALPLARMRVRGQLLELREQDLRFTLEECTAYLAGSTLQPMSPEEIGQLERRTEGWIAGLQLAALSLVGRDDVSGFVASFGGSNRFVLDYLVEEVVGRQPDQVQEFLLGTSLLDRFCAPLCEAVLAVEPPVGARMLRRLERANLFLVPLDSTREWFRYHHLFRDLLRHRLAQSTGAGLPASVELHTRASDWFLEAGFLSEAFHHAVAADDVPRAARIVAGDGMPLPFRGNVAPVLRWLESRDECVLDAEPSLWVMFGWTAWAAHQNRRLGRLVERAECALSAAGVGEHNDLWGQLDAQKAMLAANTYETPTMVAHARTALQRLDESSVFVRTAVMRTLGVAHHFGGERSEAIEAYRKTVDLCRQSGNDFIRVLTETGLAMVLETQLELGEAERTYRSVIDLVGDPERPILCEAFLGLARIAYLRNDLPAARTQAERGVRLGGQIDTIDTSVAGRIVLSRIAFASLERERQDVRPAIVAMEQCEAEAAAKGFAVQRRVARSELIRMQVLAGAVDRAAACMQSIDEAGDDEPDLLSRARLHLAQGNGGAALAVLNEHRDAMARRDWRDELARTAVLRAAALARLDVAEEPDDTDEQALRRATAAQAVRLLADEGAAGLAVADRMVHREDATSLVSPLGGLSGSGRATESRGPGLPVAGALREPLSPREMEVLTLIGRGLSNRQIAARLFIAVTTVKGHNQKIFGKLEADSRTAAVAKARRIGLLRE